LKPRCEPARTAKHPNRFNLREPLQTEEFFSSLGEIGAPGFVPGTSCRYGLMLKLHRVSRLGNSGRHPNAKTFPTMVLLSTPRLKQFPAVKGLTSKRYR